MIVRRFGWLPGVLLATGGSLFGIPQNFTTGGNFALTTGLRFEEFAADKRTWSTGALKGEWSEPKDGEQTLKEEAVVFGLPAAQITTLRTSEGVQRFRVLFRADAGKPAQSTLFERVRQNVRAFTGNAGKSDGRRQETFHHSGGVQISVHEVSPREVEVEFHRGS